MWRLLALLILCCAISSSSTGVSSTIEPLEDNTTTLPSDPTTTNVTTTGANLTAEERLRHQLLLFIEVASKYTAYQIGYALNTYMLIIVIVIGIVGNIISLMVMLQPQNRREPFCIYMLGLAINDLCMLGGLALYSWLHHELIHRPLQDVECKSGVFFFSVFSLNGVLTITVMTIERFVAVSMPLKAVVRASARRSIGLLVLLAVISVVFCIPQWIYTRTLANNLCVAFATTDVFSSIYSWFYLTVNSFLPFTIILVLNIFIVVNMKRSRRFRFKNKFNDSVKTTGSSSAATDVTTCDTSHDVTQSSVDVSTQTSVVSMEAINVASLESQVENGNGVNVKKANSVVRSVKEANMRAAEEELASRERQLTAMLVLVSLALLIFTIPQCVRYVMSNLYSFMSSPRVFADFILFYNATNKVFFINNSINFFLYCLSGSRFRADLKRLFTCSSKK